KGNRSHSADGAIGAGIVTYGTGASPSLARPRAGWRSRLRVAPLSRRGARPLAKRFGPVSPYKPDPTKRGENLAALPPKCGVAFDGGWRSARPTRSRLASRATHPDPSAVLILASEPSNPSL